MISISEGKQSLVFRGGDTLFGVKKERVAKVVDHYMATATNEKILLPAYYPRKATAAVVCFHGGCCVISDVNSYDNFCRSFAKSGKAYVAALSARAQQACVALAHKLGRRLS